MIGNRTVTALAAFVLTTSSLCFGADWKNSLAESLSAKYEITKVGLDRERITKAGTILVLRKENVVGALATDPAMLTNKVVNGVVQQASGFLAAMLSKDTNRTFSVGEQVYVFKIDVKDDAVEYHVISAKTYTVGGARQTRYRAAVSFQFPKGTLESMPLEAVKKSVDEVLASSETINDTKTKTVALGQSPQEVESVLGKPDTIVNLGAKVTYVYKSMKVIFQDGKVADVQ